MSASAFALQTAIYSALTSNSALITALGGLRVHDEVPQPAVFPYISFGPHTARDNDTADDASDLHTVTLHIWSRAHGRKEPHTLTALVRVALHDQTLTLSGHRLINLRHEQTDIRRLADGETMQCTLRFRAVTEPT